MSRMHSRKKGKASSKQPLNPTKPNWIRYKPKEIELLISKLAKEGKSASQIGLILRDSYGIPNVKLIAGKSISSILQEKKLASKLPEDLKSLVVRQVAIKKHLEKNHKDMTALRGLQLTESKINRLVKYYKLNKVLPLDWKLNEQTIKLYVE